MITRPSAPGDFQIAVGEHGNFTFGRRTPRDAFGIRGEYARLTEGNIGEDGAYNDIGALAYVTVKRLLVAAPDGFDLDKLDPNVNDEWESTIVQIFTSLREKELSFRPAKGEGSPASSA